MSLLELRPLLIDNYDSYTYNLFQLLQEVYGGDAPLVYTNDGIGFEQVKQLLSTGKVNCIVISPGPGSPKNDRDIGVVLELLQGLPQVPIFGVCLGHQALALSHGGRVMKAPEPVHGRVCEVEHNGHPLFSGIPSGPGQGFDVVRYHSLIVDSKSIPSCLEPIAWTPCAGCSSQASTSAACRFTLENGTKPAVHTSNGVAQSDALAGSQQHGRYNSVGTCWTLNMAIAHRERPHFGVQFHPESISTRYGAALIQNFGRICASLLGLQLPRSVENLVGPPGHTHPAKEWPNPKEMGSGSELSIIWSCLPGTLEELGGSLAIFEHLFSWDDSSFWLDSSSSDRGRFSYMGGKGGPLWRRITFKLPSPESSSAVGVVKVEDGSGCLHEVHSQFFDYLDRLVQASRMSVSASASKQLPFNFWGGLVGYLGFELKSECGGRNAHASPMPDAAFCLADRLIAIDHDTGDVFLIAMHGEFSESSPLRQFSAPSSSGEEAVEVGDGVASAYSAAQEWLKVTEDKVKELQSMPSLKHSQWADANGHQLSEYSLVPGEACQCHRQEKAASPRKENGSAALKPSSPPLFHLRHHRLDYLANVEAYTKALYEGDSYEVCATTALIRHQVPDPVQLYRTLRALNPAPYAAWMCFGTEGPTLCCSSPERFLRGDRGGVLEARPIKGTAPRCLHDPVADADSAAALLASEKNRAENLMIVDLLRNDLGRVCEVGSVHVPGLMEIESFATVHQMVSTVRGVRREGVSLVECIRAAFPGGSMTGAPKVRTMEILDAGEGCARGPYSGSLGFIGFNDTFDLNIIIRTAVMYAAPSAPAASSASGHCNRHSSPSVYPDARAAYGLNTLSIGAGGAIVVQSDPESEYEEMRLKARALMHAVGMCDGVDGHAFVDDAVPYSQTVQTLP